MLVAALKRALDCKLARCRDVVEVIVSSSSRTLGLRKKLIRTNNLRKHVKRLPLRVAIHILVGTNRLLRNPMV